MRVGTSSELWGVRPFIKAMLYGPSGAGKTTWASLAPRPLVILREEQGLATIIHQRPDAQVVVVESWEDFIEAFTAVKMAGVGTSKTGQPYCTADIGGRSFRFQTVIVDSFTDIQKLMMAHIRGVEVQDALDDDGNITLQEWGRIINVCDHILRDQRAIPCNTVFIFLANLMQDDRGRFLMVPSVSGKRLPMEMGQYFNGVGYATKTEAAEHVILWGSDDRFVTKTPPGWPRRIPNTVSLGSLMLATQPGNVAHEPTDTAEAVPNEKENGQ